MTFIVASVIFFVGLCWWKAACSFHS